MNSQNEIQQKLRSSESAKEWIRSKDGQEALSKAKLQAKTAAKQLEVRDPALSRLVRQKAARSFK